MKIINVEVKNSTCCAVCGHFFSLENDIPIIPYEPMACSEKCQRILIKRILSKYEQKDLVFLKKYFNIEKIPMDKIVLLIDSITEEFLKSDLSNINVRTEWTK